MVYYGLTLNVASLSGDVYINFLASASVEMLAYVACLLLLDRIGRKAMHAGTMILGGTACLCTIFTVLYADKCKYLHTALYSCQKEISIICLCAGGHNSCMLCTCENGYSDKGAKRLDMLNQTSSGLQ
jgi:hypothetical protein